MSDRKQPHKLHAEIPHSGRIGLLGGISPESTLDYYQRICAQHLKRHNNYHFPEIVIYSLDFQRYTDLEDKSGLSKRIDYMMEGVQALEKSGCTIFAMTANSAHAVYDNIAARTRMKPISIVESCREAAEKLGASTTLLLGIQFTMQSGFYEEVFSRWDLEVIVPDKKDQEYVNRVIFDELCKGVVNRSSQERIEKIIDKYHPDYTILGCTELPMLLKESTRPVIDTVEEHVKKIVECYEALSVKKS